MNERDAGSRPPQSGARGIAVARDARTALRVTRPPHPLAAAR
ncbi:hypothetical protein ACPCUV_34255 [Streptomyces platensis]